MEQLHVETKRRLQTTLGELIAALTEAFSIPTA